MGFVSFGRNSENRLEASGSEAVTAEWRCKQCQGLEDGLLSEVRAKQIKTLKINN